MPSFRELNEPVPGWTTVSLDHNVEHDHWTVCLRRVSDGFPVVKLDDKLATAWREAVTSAEYYCRTASEPRTGPPQA